MQLDPQLSLGLQSDPAFTETQTPPEGVSLAEYARQQSKAMITPYADYFKDRLPSETECAIFDKRVPVDGGEILARCAVPSNGARGETYPVLVWFHGGGWMIGDINMDDNFLRTISAELKMVTVNVEYRRTPEHPFPTPFDDCYTSLKWVAENASDLSVSLQKGFLVGGDSAGGNLTAAVALQARGDPFFTAGKQLTGQFLREPALVHPLAHPEKYKSELRSFDENRDVPLLNSERTLNSFLAYGGPPTDVRISPLLAETQAGLPPAFIITMQYDPLRDESVVYERLLREAGVRSQIVRISGTLHGFHYTFPTIERALEVDAEGRKGLRWLLSLSPDAAAGSGESL